MSRDFFDPTPEQQNLVLIDAATLRKVEKLLLVLQPLDRALALRDVLMDGDDKPGAARGIS